MQTLGMWFGRHTAFYTYSSLTTLVLSFVQVAVVTRFLAPSGYGRAGLLLLFAAMLTIAYNLGTLNGTFMRAFGAAGDEDVEDEQRHVGEGDKRRALGSGIALTLLTGLAGMLVVVPFAPTIARLLLGDASSSGLVVLAAASGGFGALWRLLLNIPRLEIRPGVFVWLSAVRPLLVIGAVAPLVATGHGVGGVVGGTAAGSGAAVLVAAVVTRHSYRLGLSMADFKAILRSGASYVPIVLAFWLVQNGDLFALSRFASDADVGLYRLAGRVGSVAMYATSALLTAWVPLRRTTVYARAAEEHGMRLGGTLFAYFCLFGMGVLLVMTVGADVLVQIAPPAYADAAPLIPLIAAAFLAHGLLVALNRTASFPAKLAKYAFSAILSALCFVALSLVLIPALGSYGAALSVMAGFGIGASVMIVLSQRGPSPMALPNRQLLAGALSAVGCLALALASRLLGGWQPLVEGLVILLFPALLIATRAVPPDHARALLRIARGAVGRRPAGLDTAGLVPAPREGRQSERRRQAVEWVNPLEVETAFEGEVRCYVHEPADARPDALVVGLSLNRRGEPGGYSHARAPMSAGCAALYVRVPEELFLGVDRATDVRASVERLLLEVLVERGVPPENVICCATSLAGGAALSLAAGCGFGHAIVGSPIVSVGETLLGEHGGRPGAQMARLLAGGAGDDREFLDSIVVERLAQARGRLDVHLLTSERDPLHDINVPALTAACEASGRLSLSVTMGDYASHGEVRSAFWPFLEERVSVILDSLPAGAEGPSAPFLAADVSPPPSGG